MKIKIKKIILLLSLILVFSSFSNPVSGEEDLSDITILFTHDMHDHFYPFKVENNDSIKELGGFSRMYTLLLEERKIDPELLLLDAGDYSMGTLFQTIFETHSPTLRTMGKLGYDATTFGNHEFDFRPEGLANSLNSAIESGDALPILLS